MKPHLINVHIPKTAGSALRATLSEIFNKVPDQPSFVINPERINSGDYFGDLRRGFSSSLPELFKRDERMLSGHYRYRDIADILSTVRDDITLITFLRDPVMRTLSDYFYSISSVHTDQAGFIERYPTLGHYMDSLDQMNKTLDYLRPDTSASAHETLQSAIEHFDFIGITENFENDLQHILAGLGSEAVSALRKNENRNRSAMLEAHEKYAGQLREVLADEYIIFNGVLNHRNLTLQ